ncbi:MAG: hypothetical protein KJO11_16320 [Gemmatimonadetes bacterium]|nr:hypothetical protein [Gemmatimonadota bacterium]MBT8403440.1 hypothetical protein [Gemmatimonadota bacterium]NNK64548.1 hypothetical protein [Gemmatimonadota bacterium]
MSAALVGISACSDSPTDPPADRLTEAEVSELVDGLASVHAFDGGFPDNDPWPCPAGGVVAPQIFRAFGGHPTRVEVDGTADYQACRVGPWTLDGPLAISVDFFLGPFGRVDGASGTSEGTLQWERSGRSGQCVIDLSVGFAQEDLSISGSACGKTVTAQPVSWGAGGG